MAIVTPATDSVPSPTPREPGWQEALRRAVRDPRQLCRLLQLPPAYHQAAQRAARQFPLVAPLELIRRMRVGDPHDPLLRQVLPIEDESRRVDGFHPDPVGDRQAVRQPGLLQKYAHRALLTATPTCAVHCRYCFRRHFDYHATPRTLDDWEPALDQVARDQQLQEVILSGGDPLVLTDRRLGELVARLGTIRHLRRLRVHSRLPVVIPQRVTSALVDILLSTQLTPIVVIHANHPAELDATVAEAVDQLLRAGIMVLNQSVLLRGVNDSVPALVELSERLIELRVTPYYLHQLDQVDGAAHFLVPIPAGQQLIAQLRRRLPGYAVPRYVQEQAGHPHKIPLG